MPATSRANTGGAPEPLYKLDDAEVANIPGPTILTQTIGKPTPKFNTGAERVTESPAERASVARSLGGSSGHSSSGAGRGLTPAKNGAVPTSIPVDFTDDGSGMPPMMQVLSTLPEYPILGDQIKDLLQFRCMGDLLPYQSTDLAVYSTDGREPLTHARLARFIEEFDLALYGIKPGDRVGMALPNGPELGVCLLGVCSKACAVPVNPQSTATEIVQDMSEVKVKILLVMGGINNTHLEEAAKTMGVPIVTLIKSDTECGIFSLVASGGRSTGGSMVKKGSLRPGQVSTMKKGSSMRGRVLDPSSWTAPDQHALVLHTSGTSGRKKIVPYTLRTMVVGSACITKSWMLTAEDINLNMMPLFHIGGVAQRPPTPFLDP